MKKLYILSTSLNPDVYINSIVHCTNDKLLQTRRIELVTIFESTKDEAKFIQKYQNTKKRIYNVLDDLASGVYNTTDGNYKPRQVKLSDDEKEIYYNSKIRIEGILFTSIIYENLKNEIEKRIEENKSGKDEESNCIFDVSGERKFLLVDILFIALSNKFKNIYVFDMLRAPNFKKKEFNLIHSLANNEYKFRNLITDSEYVKESLNELEDNDDFANVLDFNSKMFAQMIMSLGLIVSIGLLYMLAKKTTYIQENWDKIEPLSFVIFGIGIILLSFIINIILAITLQVELQLNPLKLFQNFKNYRRKKLNKKYNYK